MGMLIYSMSVSLDGFVNTPDGSLDWVHIDDELHQVFNEEAWSMSIGCTSNRSSWGWYAVLPNARGAPAPAPCRDPDVRIGGRAAAIPGARDQRRVVISPEAAWWPWSVGPVGDQPDRHRR